jgi:hypothetical protein
MKMKRKSSKAVLFSLFMLLILVSYTACQKSPVATPTTWNPTTGPVATPTTQNPTTGQVAPLGEGQTGDLTVKILSDHNPPVSGNNTFKAFITDPKGQTISDAKLTFDFDMTNMNMGSYVVTPSSLGEGWYSSAVSFSMPGPWRVIVRIDRAGQINTVEFDFGVN